MSERYGDCKLCHGMGFVKYVASGEVLECPRCNGTGFNGEVID